MVHFDLLMLKGGTPGAVWTAVDVLRGLNALERVRSPKSQAAATSWRVIDSRAELHPFHALTCVTAAERRRASSRRDGQQVLLVPPLETRSVPELERLAKLNAEAVELIRRAHEAGALIGACGTGIWLAAAAGCITAAPVPWYYQAGFARVFPKIQIEARKSISMTPRVACAAAPELGYSLVLHLAHAAGLADLAQAGAQAMLFNSERQDLAARMESEYFGGTSREVPLHIAQSWLHANAGRPLHLAEAARAAAVSERTLNRLFRQHLDCSPLQYLQDIRIKRACMWLETTWRSVDEIAHDSGYRDTSAFCRMFARATGESPQRHRERLTMRGPRARWKVEEADVRSAAS